MKTLKVGDVLWFVPNERRIHAHNACEVTVCKVGRKWGYVNGWHWRRIELDTGRVDQTNFGCVGRVFNDRTAWERREEAIAWWRRLKRTIEHLSEPPDGCTAEHVRTAAAHLRVAIEMEKS